MVLNHSDISFIKPCCHLSACHMNSAKLEDTMLCLQAKGRFIFVPLCEFLSACTAEVSCIYVCVNVLTSWGLCQEASSTKAGFRWDYNYRCQETRQLIVWDSILTVVKFRYVL